MAQPAEVNEVAAARERLEAVRREVSRVYMGPARVLDAMLVALLAHGHVLLEGVPGVAKTTLVKSFATALGCTVRRIQFTADLLPADITGTYVLSPRDGTFAMRPGPVFANVVLADEITNPIDLEGTYPLPEAQIDRFLLLIPMGYPTHQEEVAMLETHNAEAPVARPQLDVNDLLRLQSITARVHVEHDLYEYAVGLTTFTRTHARVTLGASPRATLSLIQAAKGAAVLAGRPFATPDDIRELAPSVLAHRLVMTPEAEGDAHARAAVITEAIARVGYRRSVRPV